MKSLKTILALGKVVGSVLAVNKYAKPLDDLRAQGKTEEEKELIYRLEQEWSKGLLDKFGWKVELTGAENIPEKGPVVVVSNHQSYLDIPGILSVMPFQMGFIAKSEFRKVPIFSDWILRIRGLFIERGDARSSLRTIGEGADLIKEGFSMAIFPEGTRSQGPEMKELKAGSMKLATKAGCPVLPVTISGSYRLYEETGNVVEDQSFKIIVHPMIETAGLSRKELSELTGKVDSIIRSGLE